MNYIGLNGVTLKETVLHVLIVSVIFQDALRHRSLTDLVLKCRDFQTSAPVKHTYTKGRRQGTYSFRHLDFWWPCTHSYSAGLSTMCQYAIHVTLKYSKYRIKLSWQRILPTFYLIEIWVCLRYFVTFTYVATDITMWNWNVDWARGGK
jgi:hypothetical protein